MRIRGIIILFVLTACAAVSGFAVDTCAICGRDFSGGRTVYLGTDKVTGERKLICSECVKLPDCYLCGLPVKNGIQLPDGRWVCSRDSKTVVLSARDVVQTSAEVENDLDRLFSRYTSFPENVDVSAIDHVDVASMFDTIGNTFEAPNLLGCIKPVDVDGQARYEMHVLTGLPLSELKETCAHEYSHAWVGENVSKERHQRIARDAEEGFCEMVGYLLMDSQGEEHEKARVLQNRYTRGQVQLFIAAEREYGFDQILDWMQYGETSRLEEGHLEAIRNVKMPAAKTIQPVVVHANVSAGVHAVPAAPATTIKLQGILAGNQPSAIINGRTVFANDTFTLKLGGTNLTLHCLEIGKNFVRIQNCFSKKEDELRMQ